MFGQISFRLLRSFLLSLIVYAGICSAIKFDETTFNTTNPTTMPTIRSSPTPTIQSVDYTVMQAFNGIVFPTSNQTIFKNALKNSVSKILVILPNAVKVISVTANKRRLFAQDMERLPSLEAIGVEAIYIVTATGTDTSAITNTLITNKAPLTDALKAAGFITASPQPPSVSTFQRLSPSAAPSELKTTSAAFLETNSHNAVLACTFFLVLIQSFVF